jgi:hypothetical protein
VFGPSAPTLSEERRRRYALDRAVLAELLPQVRHLIWADGHGAIAEGPVDVDIGAGCWEQVEISIIFDEDYPASPPRVYDRARRWPVLDDRHIMKAGQFCLWLPYVDVPDFRHPDAFEDFLLRLLPFLRDQFVFDDLGKWPGEQWAHGWRDAYAQHLVEQLAVTSVGAFEDLWPAVLGVPQRPDRACPCGSRRNYGACHRRRVLAVAWMRRLGVRAELPQAVAERFRYAA